MNIFNWAMKGVNVERRANNNTTPTAVEVAQPTMITEAAPIMEMPQPDPRSDARLRLFTDNYTPQPQFAAPAPNPYVTPGYSTPAGLGGALHGNSFGNRHILIVVPRTNDDVTGLVNHLRTNEAVIVNFDGIPTVEAQRQIDFLGGVVFALGGTIKPLDEHKYILTPSGIGVR